MRRRESVRWLLAAACALVIGACSSAPPAPPAPPADTAGDQADTTAVEGADAEAGAALFRRTCATCHGDNARGRAFVGPDLIDNTFVQGLTDAELLAFIVGGRPADHPDNTTGIPMPPRGGDPNLSDAQISDIIAWLRAEA